MLRLSSRIAILFSVAALLIVAVMVVLGVSLAIAGIIALSLATLGSALFALIKPADDLIIASLRFNDGIDEVPEIVRTGKRSPFAPVAETLSHFGDLVHKQSRTFWTERLEKEAVLESLEEGVIITDTEGSVTQLNAVASRMLGVDPKEVVGRRMVDIASQAPFFAQCAEALSSTLARRGVTTDSISVNEGGAFDIVATPRAKGEGAIIVIRDGSRGHKLEQMGRDFIANASHELRTPITIIRGFAETLRDMPEISEAMLEDITDKIIRNCERMSNLVKSLITLADLDATAQVPFQKCDLIALAEKCEQMVLSVHPDVTIEIVTTEDEVFARCDPNLIELALMNLLENGVKYGDVGMPIAIRIERGNEGAFLSVENSGKGIPQGDLDHIFDRFYTIDKTHSRKLGGAGLGLSIVKRIAAIHGANVSVTSNGKTTFTIGSLPS